MYAEDKLPHFHSGKVRDTKLIPAHPELLLPIASHRFSTHNIVHVTEIPGKGEFLTAQMIFWVLNVLNPLGIRHHVVAWGRNIYDYLPPGEYSPRLHYRGIVVRRLTMLMYEFVFRNYLTGSLEKAYMQGLDPYKLKLQSGLPKMYHFPKPVFTPTDKSDTDVPQVASDVYASWPRATDAMRRTVCGIDNFLRPRGLTLIDHKGEMSVDEVVADEFGTGDCSRIARTSDIRSGEDPRWLDKENGRVIAVEKWGGRIGTTPLEFSAAEIARILRGYEEAFEAITLGSLARFQKEHFE